MSDSSGSAVTGSPSSADEAVSVLELLVPIAENIRVIVAGALLCGVTALGITYLLTPVYMARTSFLPPQQQSAAASALSSLGGALAGLAGGAVGLRAPADQYVSLMQSVTVQDRLIDQFRLIDVYEAKFRADARLELQRNVNISIGKRDGLITVEVEDTSPERAAAMANQHVEELRRLSGLLALTEAQQRRMFFEGQLKQTRERLEASQQALQSSGINAATLRAEPKAAAEGYARLKAEMTAAEVRLQALRRSMTDSAPEVAQQLAVVTALRAQLAQLEQVEARHGGPDYVSKYREYKYQETLFELFARQFELARLDESREGAVIQVVDVAAPPEKKSRPRRAATAVATTIVAGFLLSGFFVIRHLLRLASTDAATAARLQRLGRGLRRSRG